VRSILHWFPWRPWRISNEKLRLALLSAQEAGRNGLALYAENERLRSEVMFLRKTDAERAADYVSLSEYGRLQDELKLAMEKNAVLLTTIRKMEKGHEEIMSRFTTEEV
jgi:hypothetical protein